MRGIQAKVWKYQKAGTTQREKLQRVLQVWCKPDARWCKGAAACRLRLVKLHRPGWFGYATFGASHKLLSWAHQTSQWKLILAIYKTDDTSAKTLDIYPEVILPPEKPNGSADDIDNGSRSQTSNEERRKARHTPQSLWVKGEDAQKSRGQKYIHNLWWCLEVIDQWREISKTFALFLPLAGMLNIRYCPGLIIVLWDARFVLQAQNPAGPAVQGVVAGRALCSEKCKSCCILSWVRHLLLQPIACVLELTASNYIPYILTHRGRSCTF